MVNEIQEIDEGEGGARDGRTLSYGEVWDIDAESRKRSDLVSGAVRRSASDGISAVESVRSGAGMCLYVVQYARSSMGRDCRWCETSS
jgi:hypothetical protein